MKKTAIILAVLLILSACGYMLFKGKSGDYRCIIPKESQLVASISAGKMAKESGIGDSHLMGKAKEYISILAGEAGVKELDQFFTSPSQTGLDFDSRIYVFKLAGESWGMTVKMSDRKKFDDFVETLRGQGMMSKAQERDGLKWTSLMDEIEAVYDKSALLLMLPGDMGGSQAKQLMQKMMKKDKKESFSDNGNGENVFKGESDIELYSLLSALPSTFLDKIKTLIGEKIPTSSLIFQSSMDFKDGEALMDYRIEGRDESATKMLNELNSETQTIKGNHLANTGNAMAIAAVGVKGEKLLEKLKQNNEIKQMLFMLERGIDIEKMIRSIDGDLTIMSNKPLSSLGDVENLELQFTGDCKDMGFLKDVGYWNESMKGTGMRMTSTGKDSYKLSAGGFDLYWNVNDRQQLNVSLNSPISESNGSEEIPTIEPQTKLFVYIKGENIDSFVLPALSVVKTVTLTGKEMTEGKIRIEGVNKDENILKTLVTNIRITR